LQFELHKDSLEAEQLEEVGHHIAVNHHIEEVSLHIVVGLHIVVDHTLVLPLVLRQHFKHTNLDKGFHMEQREGSLLGDLGIVVVVDMDYLNIRVFQF
jgi:hypothetical protein